GQCPVPDEQFGYISRPPFALSAIGAKDGCRTGVISVRVTGIYGPVDYEAAVRAVMHGPNYMPMGVWRSANDRRVAGCPPRRTDMSELVLVVAGTRTDEYADCRHVVGSNHSENASRMQ